MINSIITKEDIKPNQQRIVSFRNIVFFQTKGFVCWIIQPLTSLWRNLSHRLIQLPFNQCCQHSFPGKIHPHGIDTSASLFRFVVMLVEKSKTKTKNKTTDEWCLFLLIEGVEDDSWTSLIRSLIRKAQRNSLHTYLK